MGANRNVFSMIGNYYSNESIKNIKHNILKNPGEEKRAPMVIITLHSDIIR